MKKLVEAAPPEGSLIAPYGAAKGHYVDAFHTDTDNNVDLSGFIRAFYGTPLFRLERLVLRFAARTPSTDSDVERLASGAAQTFAVWTVQERRADEILLKDATGRTMSWLRVAPAGTGTRLWFGSVVVPVERRGQLTLGPVFGALIGAHKVYSRLLLGSASAHPALTGGPRVRDQA